jgi:hypothetical protein
MNRVAFVRKMMEMYRQDQQSIGEAENLQSLPFISTFCNLMMTADETRFRLIGEESRPPVVVLPHSRSSNSYGN